MEKNLQSVTNNCARILMELEQRSKPKKRLELPKADTVEALDSLALHPDIVS